MDTKDGGGRRAKMAEAKKMEEAEKYKQEADRAKARKGKEETRNKYRRERNG